MVEKNITFDILYNADEVFETYGALKDPTYVIIDKRGQIRLQKSAFFTGQTLILTGLIDDLIKE